MHFRTDLTLKILAMILIFGQSEATVANLLADRALAKLSKWVVMEGSTWLTLPGHFQQGLVQNLANKYTLAFAGPKLTKIGELARIGDASLDEAEPDPMYKTMQKLRFKATLANATVIYNNVAYTEDDLGSFNFTLSASIDNMTVEITLDVKGDMETCEGFLDEVYVNDKGAASATTGDMQTDHKVPAVISVITTHFQNNIFRNLRTLLESGTLNSLNNYDICNDVYNPLLPANILTERILKNMVEGLNSNVSNWARLPGFSKEFRGPDGKVTNTVTVNVGNFDSVGAVRRSGDASYSNNGSQQYIAMNFEADSITGVYPNISFTDHTTQHQLSDRITTQKLSISLSAQVYKSPYSHNLLCNNVTLLVNATYNGGQLKTELMPALPQQLFDMVNSTVADGFLRSLEKAATDLFKAAAIEAFSTVCPSTNTHALPPANEIADQILTAMGKLVAENANKWVHLPGSIKQYFAPNATLIYYITTGWGNITDVGLTRRTDAAYSDENSNLHIVFETDALSVTYKDVLYVSNWVKYKMVETINSNKLTTTLDVSFSIENGGIGIPTCNRGSVSTSVSYDGGVVEVANLTAGVPDDVQSSAKSQLSSSFPTQVIAAAEDLYLTAAVNAMAEVCPSAGI